ncbi:MAG: hypothetical protein WCK08_17355, partial [Betaproteobacteria bacterium]
MNIGDFVHLNGDFKLTLGQSFKADMATGLDPLLGLAADAAINAAAGAFMPGLEVDSVFKYLLDVSDDYSVAHDVTFKGLTFGASNVNMFVGAGSPDFKKPFSEQGDLVGFGLQNLSVAIANFRAYLPQFFGAQSVFSFSAHANEMGVYGMGDMLKILGKDITVDVNSGGKALGGLMRAMPVYSSIKNAGAPDGLKIATGGAPVYLDLNGTEIVGLDVGLAEIAVADFLHLRGSLAFRKGEQYDVAVDLGGLAPLANQLGQTLGTSLNPLPLRVEALTLGGSNLTGFAGVGGPYRYGPDLTGGKNKDTGADIPDGLPDYINDGAVGLAVDNVDFGLAIMQPASFNMIPSLSAYTPKFISAKAYVGTAALVGVDEDILTVKAQDIEINVNTFYW